MTSTAHLGGGAIADEHDPNTTGLTTPEELAGLGLEVLGVPETAGLVVRDHVVTVVGDGPVRRLTDGAATPLDAGRTFSAVDDSTAPAAAL